MSGPLEIRVGPFTLAGEPGGHVDVWDEVNRIAAKVPSAHVAGLAEALLAFVVQPPAPPVDTRRPSAAECRSCRQLIFWAVTPAGRKMPVDAGPTVDGTLVLSLRGGQLHIDTWRADEPAHAPPRRRYTSHFSSCSRADDHRRPR